MNKAQSDYSLSTGLALVSEVVEQVLPEHEVNEAMFRLILLTAQEIERRSTTTLPLSYFAFWTVRLAGWLPRFDLCAVCGKPFGKGIAYEDRFHPGLYGAEHRRPGMKSLSHEGRELGEVFAKQRLDQLDEALTTLPGVKELRDAGLNWVEHHTERKLNTRALLEP